jgi:uncharacterized protein YgbK (DUF1537 family)
VRTGLPSRVVSWYGDDFTGSTDVLEALAPHMPAVLFLRPPDEAFFEQFKGYAAFGLAGVSRSETPRWMDENLPGAFEWLKSLGTAICHYKVCSTFDSSPAIGNIGRAMEIGKRIFGGSFVPVVMGVPSLRRFTVFGNLFAAAADGQVYRIDRHPGMMNHPVTPMSEADLRLHLAKQSDLKTGLLDVAQLESPEACERYRAVASRSEAVLIDVMNQSCLARAGKLLWDVDRQPFVAGSSGVAYALLSHWDAGSGDSFEAAPVDRLVVLSGSCSPATLRQIQHAGLNGFRLVRVHPSDSLGDDSCIEAALEALSSGHAGVVIYTAGAASDRVEGFGRDERKNLSERSGRILDRVLERSSARRVVIAGGDTSSHAGSQLSIDALTFAAHLAPGAPLCKVWSRLSHRRGLEIVFKGGQCGNDDFFETVRKGSTGRRN